MTDRLLPSEKPESPTLETLLDELLKVGSTCCGFDSTTGTVTIPDEDEDIRSSREAVTQRFAEIQARHDRIIEALDLDEPIVRSLHETIEEQGVRLAELEAEIKRLKKKDKAFGYRRDEFRYDGKRSSDNEG